MKLKNVEAGTYFVLMNDVVTATLASNPSSPLSVYRRVDIVLKDDEDIAVIKEGAHYCVLDKDAEVLPCSI